jgi:hypothetical protein
MPNVRLVACPGLRICPICQEYQCAKGNNCQLCFHDDFSPVILLPPQARSPDVPVIAITRIPPIIPVRAITTSLSLRELGSTGKLPSINGLIEQRDKFVRQVDYVSASSRRTGHFAKYADSLNYRLLY